MFCPQCGKADQTLRFCTGCGAALHAPAVHSPSISNKVNVNVNLGGPSLVNNPGPTESPVARAVGRVWKSVNDAKVRQRETDELRGKVATQLRVCDILIQEIESSIVLHLIPPASPVHQAYMQALELRRQSLDTVNSGPDHEQVLVAREKANRALQGLTEVRAEIERGASLAQ